MIVVEGPDGAGKTTLIEKLLNDFDLELQPKVVSSDTKAMTDLATWIEAQNSRGWDREKPRLYDRHGLISEPIYCNAMNRSPKRMFDNWGWLALELVRFYNEQPIIIYCLPPLEVVRHNVMKEETDNAAISDQITGIWVAYARQAATDAITRGSIIYNYTEDRYENLVYRLAGSHIPRRRLHSSEGASDRVVRL